MQKLLKKQDGFTLLELLIVIVIIGILAVLIIPNLASGPARARDAQRKSDLRNVKTALETYYNDNNSYPTANPGGGSAASCVIAGNSTCIGAALSSGTTPYMKTVPSDPKNTGSYVYTYLPTPSGCSTACVSYSMTATLENTKDPQATNGVYTVNSAN